MIDPLFYFSKKRGSAHNFVHIFFIIYLKNYLFTKVLIFLIIASFSKPICFSISFTGAEIPNVSIPMFKLACFVQPKVEANSIETALEASQIGVFCQLDKEIKLKSNSLAISCAIANSEPVAITANLDLDFLTR